METYVQFTEAENLLIAFVLIFSSAAIAVWAKHKSNKD